MDDISAYESSELGMELSNYTNLNWTYIPNEIEPEPLRIIARWINVTNGCLGILFSVILISIVITSQALREKASCWLLVNIAVCNVIHLIGKAGGNTILEFLRRYPYCYASLPVQVIASEVMNFTMLIYAIIITHEARKEVSKRDPTGCRKGAVLTILAIVWIIATAEVLIVGFGFGDMQLYDNLLESGKRYCFFMLSFAHWVNGLRTLIMRLPLLLLLICGIVLSCFACKSAAVRGTSTPVILMCIITPLLHVPITVLEAIGYYDISVNLPCYTVQEFSWMLLPLCFLLFGEGRRECQKTCCKCCVEQANEESINLIMK